MNLRLHIAAFHLVFWIRAAAGKYRSCQSIKELLYYCFYHFCYEFNILESQDFICGLLIENYFTDGKIELFQGAHFIKPQIDLTAIHFVYTNHKNQEIQA